MMIFVTGATGFIGSYLVPELISAGHQVVRLTRSDVGVDALQRAGADVSRGDVNDLDHLRAAVETADAVIHTAFNHDFANMKKSSEDDRKVIATLGGVLKTSSRPLLVTSGTGLVRPQYGSIAKEFDPPAASIEVPRAATEEAANALIEAGVHVLVVRLPQVHDTRKLGRISLHIDLAKKKGWVAYIGDGANRVPAAHVSDVARLFRLAIERGEAGEHFHAVAEQGIATREISEVIGRALGVVRKDAADNDGSFELIELDLASLASARHGADKLLFAGKPLNIIIANAGVMATPFGKTADGFETQLGTNHLGHFVFINRVASLLASGGRLVNLSSSGHRISNVSLDDPNFESTPYEPFVAYGRSKTANILLAVEFDRRHKGRGIRATAVHPGGIMTELARHMDPAHIEAITKQMSEQAEAQGERPFQWKTIPQGAATSVWAAIVAPAQEIGAEYCENCHVSSIVSDDHILGLMAEGVRSYALDPANAKALGKKSEEMVGETFA